MPSRKTLVAAITVAVWMALVSPVQATATPPLSSTETEFAKLAESARQLQADLAAVETELNTSNLEIIDTYHRLEVAESRLITLQTSVDERFRNIYKRGRNDLMDFLLNYDDFADFWSRMRLLAKVNSFDSRALTDRAHQLRLVQELRDSIAERKMEGVRLRRERVAQVRELQVALAQKAQLIQVLQQRASAGSNVDAKYLSEFALNNQTTP